VSAPLPTTPRPSGSELVRTIAAGTAVEVGTAFLRSLVRHVAQALDVDIAFAAEVEPGGWQHATVVASWGRRGVELPEGAEYEIPGTPCELAAGQDVVTLPRGTREAFPADAFVARHGLDGYLAIVLRGSDGRRLGYLGVMSSRELDAGEETLAVLRIFAARAGAEIERRHQEAELLRREAEIAASRARLVSVADEERRQIGRNLHDGAQQRMIVLGHRIALAQRKLEQSPEEAAEHLRHAGEEARAAASRVRVDVAQRSDRVVVEVSDDGCGGAEASAGTGLSGLAGRLEALGGTLEVTSPPGEGTRLRAVLPLGPWRTAREPFLEFGHADDDGLGAKLIAQVLSGEKTATISLAREWELEGGTPKIGQRLPVIDHHGRRHAVVEVVRIAVMAFGEVDTGTVAEHEPDGPSVAEWRERQLDYYGRCREQVATLLGEPGWRLTPSEPLVVLRFRFVEP
jgi:uncharacterized protein YhfF